MLITNNLNLFGFFMYVTKKNALFSTKLKYMKFFTVIRMLNDVAIEESINIRSIRPASIPVRTFQSPLEGNAIKELAGSIRQHGLIQPITVRPVENGFEIVAGHRRFKACKLLRWRVIPAMVRSLSNQDAFEVQLVENIHRMTMDPIEEAEAFKKYILDYGWGGISQLSRIISKSEQFVSSRIQLLRLPKEIIDNISQNKLKVSHAIELVNLKDDDRKFITSVVIDRNLSVQSIREIVRHVKQGEQVQEIINQDTIDNISQESNDNNNNSQLTVKQIRLLKKTLLSLRISLTRIDSLIDEANIQLDPNGRIEIISKLMQFRLKIHSMIDEDIRAITELNKKL
jgi:ParB family transcriptional regulator, chromosome partitioning protein